MQKGSFVSMTRYEYSKCRIDAAGLIFLLGFNAADVSPQINDVVYDLTDFLQHHPEQRNAILAWAGRDATPMWNKIPGRFPSISANVSSYCFDPGLWVVPRGAHTIYIYTQSHTHVLVDLYFRSLSRNNLGAVRPCVLQGKNWMEFYMRPEAEMGKVAPEPPVEPKEKDWATFTKIIYTIYFHNCSFLFGCTHGMFKVW